VAEGWEPRLIEEAQAPPEVRGVLEEAAPVLRSTWTPDLLRALAAWPELLGDAWAQLAPNLRTRFFEESADRVRLKAVEEAAPLVAKRLAGAPAPGEWQAEGELVAAIDGYHYVYPKVLLAAAALFEALRGAEPGFGPLATEELSEVPLGAPEGMAPLAPPAEDDLSPEARSLLARLRALLEAPVLPEVFATVARWPEALQNLWDLVGAARTLDGYGARVNDLAEFARRQSHYLPYGLDLPPHKLIGMGLRPQVVASALNYFEATLAEAVLLVAALEVIFRGHPAARNSPFPVPELRS